MEYLKGKVDAGATFIFTQMFYDIEMFVAWVKAARAAGITVPIVPGIMPIQTWNGFQKATSLAKITVPQFFLDELEPHKNNDEKVREIGIRLVATLCRQILSADIGIKGLHFYTMNLEKGCRMLLEELNLVPRVDVVKPLPWRQVRVESLSFCLNRVLTHRMCSRSLPTAAWRTSVRSSGRIAPALTSRARRTGTSTPTVVSETRARPRTASSTVMVSGSSNPKRMALNSGITRHLSTTSADCSPSSVVASSQRSRGPTQRRRAR